MANIILCYRVDTDRFFQPVETYSRCFHKAVKKLGHKVTAVGEGHKTDHVNKLSSKEVKKHDLFIDLDCGRNKSGGLHFQGFETELEIPKAVWFIDSHGYPSLHKRNAEKYKHVFFAVYRRRDLFAKHESSYWAPNASDSEYFSYKHFHGDWSNPKNHIGFFGSKGGLDRADILRSICNRHHYLFNIKEIGRDHGHRWPATAEAMGDCKMLFNKGQKHDGPNQRVIESMLMCRPLLTDRDKEDGMDLLFEEGTHFLGWSNESELAEQIRWVIRNGDLANRMALRAYKEAIDKHQIIHRVEKILEICLND